MGSIKPPPPVKLFTGVLCAFPELLPKIRSELTNTIGAIDFESDSFQFDSTSYYAEEMGSQIQRRFMSFEALADLEALAQIKIRTNQLEEYLMDEKLPVARPVNLDPGYLEQAKVILFSTKNFYHRIFVTQGIYAEVTMHFENGDWRYFPWTFPDFRTGRYNPFFSEVRRRHRSQLRDQRG